MSTPRNLLSDLKRRISFLFAERNPALRVAIAEDEFSEYATAMKTELTAGAALDVSEFDPKTQPVLNPETQEAAQFLLLMFCGFRDFQAFDQQLLIPLVEHLQSVAKKWKLREPALWSQILDDPALIERLCADDNEGDNDA